MRLSCRKPLLVLGVAVALALLSGALATLVRAAQPAPGGTVAAATVGAIPADERARSTTEPVPATAAQPGPADVGPQPVIRVVAAQPTKPVLCAHAAATKTPSERQQVAPTAAAADPCDAYVAECPARSIPSGTFGVCTKNCAFGKPVPVNTDCAPEPTKRCEYGPPVPGSKTCPPEPTKPCEFGSPVPVSKTCPPEPTKPCRFGPSTPISKECTPEPTKSCEFGPPVAFSQNCPPEPREPCVFGFRVPVGQKCLDEPVWNCQFSDPVPVSQDCPPEPTKTCPNGVVTGLDDPCPQRTVSCPNGTVVAKGKSCPEKSVRCPDGQVVPTGIVCPPPVAVCPGGVHVPEGTSCPPPPCPLRASLPETGCEPARTPRAAANSAKPVMPVPKSGELVFDKATSNGADVLYARGAGCEPGGNVVLTTRGAGGTMEIVGHAAADADGRFEATVQFASLRAGYREVTAHCGTLLVSGVDMVLTSSTGETSRTYVLLLFLFLFGSLVVRFQVGKARRVRRR